MVRSFTVHFSNYSENIATCLRKRNLQETCIINLEEYTQKVVNHGVPNYIKRLRVYYIDNRPMEEQEDDME